MEYNHALVDKLLGKSKEAFLMAIEVYNKPSIRYRVEGFSFFIWGFVHNRGWTSPLKVQNAAHRF